MKVSAFYAANLTATRFWSYSHTFVYYSYLPIAKNSGIVQLVPLGRILSRNSAHAIWILFNSKSFLQHFDFGDRYTAADNSDALGLSWCLRCFYSTWSQTRIAILHNSCCQMLSIRPIDSCLSVNYCVSVLSISFVCADTRFDCS